MAKLIMAVDGTTDILDLYQAVLTEEGYEVSLHDIDNVNLDTIRKTTPDLIITDFKFGKEEDAWVFLQEVKMNQRTTAIPIILCTTNVFKVRELDEQLKSKNIITLTKPFNIDDLLTTVAKALG